MGLFSRTPPPPPPPPVLDIGVLDFTMLGALFAFHAGVYLVLRSLMGDKRSRRPSQEAVGGTRGAQSTVAAVLTLNITGICYAILTTYLGFKAWYGAEAAAIAGSAHDRLYGRSETFQLLGAATAAYEAYNTLLTLVTPEYRTVDFVGHHFTTFLLALFGSYPFLNYYGIFFFGTASVSSIPLCLAEAAKCFDAERFVMAFQAAFAGLFILFRTFYWPLVSFHFWSDSMAALSADDAAPPGVPRAHSVAAYAVFLVANLGLTSLQLLWTTKIVRAVMGGNGAKKEP